MAVWRCCCEGFQTVWGVSGMDGLNSSWGFIDVDK